MSLFTIKKFLHMHSVSQWRMLGLFIAVDKQFTTPHLPQHSKHFIFYYDI